jgi:hypothetical protein
MCGDLIEVPILSVFPGHHKTKVINEVVDPEVDRDADTEDVDRVKDEKEKDAIDAPDEPKKLLNKLNRIPGLVPQFNNPTLPDYHFERELKVEIPSIVPDITKPSPPKLDKSDVGPDKKYTRLRFKGRKAESGFNWDGYYGDKTGEFQGWKDRVLKANPGSKIVEEKFSPIGPPLHVYQHGWMYQGSGYIVLAQSDVDPFADIFSALDEVTDEITKSIGYAQSSKGDNGSSATN